jgi:hypothetical protein
MDAASVPSTRRLTSLKLHASYSSALEVTHASALGALSQLRALKLVGCCLGGGWEAGRQLTGVTTLSCSWQGSRQQFVGSLAALPHLKVRAHLKAPAMSPSPCSASRLHDGLPPLAAFVIAHRFPGDSARMT